MLIKHQSENFREIAFIKIVLITNHHRVITELSHFQLYTNPNTTTTLYLWTNWEISNMSCNLADKVELSRLLQIPCIEVSNEDIIKLKYNRNTTSQANFDG